MSLFGGEFTFMHKGAIFCFLFLCVRGGGVLVPELVGVSFPHPVWGRAGRVASVPAYDDWRTVVVMYVVWTRVRVWITAGAL